MMAAVSKTFEDVKALVLTAHKNTTTKETADFYNGWAKNYEQDLVLLEYRAPNLAASRVSSHFSGAPDTALVLDVACGTGLVAKQMKEYGFKHFVGVDGSEGMLEQARETQLYQDLRLCVLGEEPLPAEWANSFDVVLIIGGLSTSQVQFDVVRDLCRAAKPGGYICMSTRGNKDNLQFKASLESELKQMEKEGLWTRVEVTEVENWEKAVSEVEEGYIPGAVYLYKKSL